VVVPDAMALLLLLPGDPIKAKTNVIKVQQHMLKHCAEHGDRLAILDAFPSSDRQSLEQQINQLTPERTDAERANAAFYYPWIRVSGTSPENLSKNRFVPPCGHMAGIFARSDRERGVFKAPANEEILGAIDLEIALDNSTQSELNAQGINCLRAFPGRGIRIWGARTLSQDPNWRYLNVRRLFLTLKRWIDLNMGWATFEPNTPPLWNRIQRELSTCLTQLWRQGALKGETQDQAFYVKCDATTNLPENREYGKVFTEIGLAPSFPAEFITVQITLQVNTAEAG
jgi:phage tail sheath protein FI